MHADTEYEESGFLRKYGFVFGIGVVVLTAAGVVVGQVAKGDHSAPPRAQEVFIVRPMPPPPPTPPPPPPPKTVEPPKEVVEKMVEQTPLDQPENKPDDRPKDSASPLTTSLTGPGNDGFGLGAGNGFGTGRGGTGGGGSRFGWYAGEVQQAIQDALNRNPVTNHAQFVQKTRIWADASGRLIRLRLAGSTGDPEVDRAIEAALTGLQLPEPPPTDMPMPIVMRISARRPG
jgi:outer membrane biosynthesis protein TonB